VIAFEVRPVDVSVVRQDSQHREYRWMHEQEVLASALVHDNTKAYFRPSEAVRRDGAPPST
jgi:hypothetical protein